MILSQNHVTLFELLRAGLWSKEAWLSLNNSIDFSAIMQLAEEQSVVGLITAGLENVVDVKIPQEILLQFIGGTLQIEQKNRAMNEFVARLIEKLRGEDVYVILVKGQGIAQCYEKPLWRASGDVDLLLSKDNYNKAKMFLSEWAFSVDEENKIRLHLGMTIDGWVVELHGTLFTDISKALNKVVSQVQSSIFYGGEVRSWNNGETVVFLPSPDNDVFLVFSHIMEHFYIEGIGLRQICDWCRLLWTYRSKINVKLLEHRLKDAKIMTEWKGFAAFAVENLGMTAEAIPFYDDSPKWRKKADRIWNLILKSGNFGHNKDNSYRVKSSKVQGLLITFWRRVKEFSELTMIFPSQTPRIFLTYVVNRVRANL